MHASPVDAPQDGQVVQGPAVPHVDLRMVSELSGGHELPALVGHRQTQHFLVVLQVESLLVNLRVVEDDDAGREVDDLFVVLPLLLLELLLGACRLGHLLADCVLHRPLSIRAAHSVDPL